MGTVAVTQFSCYTYRDFHVESFSDELFDLIELLLFQVDGNQQQQLSIGTVATAGSIDAHTYMYM